jgi:hypothetical protein
VICTHDGKVIVSSQLLLPNKARHATIAHVSADAENTGNRARWSIEALKKQDRMVALGVNNRGIARSA